MASRPTPIALTIAGSDPSGGAGIQADLRTFAALDVFGCAVVAAVTAQNSREVAASWPLPARHVRAQLKAVLSDVRLTAAKTGMLANAGIVRQVALALRAHDVPNLVIDPVIRAKDGSPLLDDAGLFALKSELLPLACLVTPNALEAAALSGLPVRNIRQARTAAEKILALDCRAVLVKGGHLPRKDGRVVDLFYDGRRFSEIGYAALAVEPRGTGCVLSAAIVAMLAKGAPLSQAVRAARAFLQRALRNPRQIGAGRPSLLPFS